MKFSVIKQRRLWWSISGIAVIASIIAMVISFSQFSAPLRPGLDFVGGTRLQLTLDCATDKQCEERLETNQVRDVLEAEGLDNNNILIIEDYTVAIRTKTDLNVDKRTELLKALAAEIGKFAPQSIQIDTVGPTIGQELFISGLLALIVAFFGIIVYLSFRFQFDYAVFAILALFHDAFITAGVFAILGLVIGVEVDSLFLVALLTIVGFSVNDTVVIYDRIRETTKQHPNDTPRVIVDDAVNQTLMRSINTTLTTLLPLIAIFFFGGETLKYFALALIIGFVLGAYSSIFVASTLLAWWREMHGEKQISLGETQVSNEQ
ncbi:MAG: protein translocase subunit SecF [Okeania sp. SIO2D1]|nr:protein translocase subunit SecF [Okeania sp. SIO2D1]